MLAWAASLKFAIVWVSMGNNKGGLLFSPFFSVYKAQSKSHIKLADVGFIPIWPNHHNPPQLPLTPSLPTRESFFQLQLKEKVQPSIEVAQA